MLNIPDHPDIVNAMRYGCPDFPEPEETTVCKLCGNITDHQVVCESCIAARANPSFLAKLCVLSEFEEYYCIPAIYSDLLTESEILDALAEAVARKDCTKQCVDFIESDLDWFAECCGALKGGEENMNLPDRIITYRAKHNLSQGAFAERCHLSIVTVNSIERGYQSPSKVTVAKIELVLKEDENHD